MKKSNSAIIRDLQMELLNLQVEHENLLNGAIGLRKELDKLNEENGKGKPIMPTKVKIVDSKIEGY